MEVGDTDVSTPEGDRPAKLRVCRFYVPMEQRACGREWLVGNTDISSPEGDPAHETSVMPVIYPEQLQLMWLSVETWNVPNIRSASCLSAVARMVTSSSGQSGSSMRSSTGFTALPLPVREECNRA